MKKETIKAILGKFASGEKTLEETNHALLGADAGFYLNPLKNVLTEEEKQATTVGDSPDQANGWGMLDTGTGTLDKVKVTNGKLPFPVNAVLEDGNTNAYALCIIAGRTYKVKGDTLVE